MNIALLCVLIIITGDTDGIHVENARTAQRDKTGQRILLRKLQNFQRNDPRETETTTWNQILADALVNRIKIFSFGKVTESVQSDTEVKSNFLTNCVSQMMHLYKVFIYDKFNRPIDSKNIKGDEHADSNKENKKGPNDDAIQAVEVDIKKDIEDPKDEVEIVESMYHGKLCDNCDKNTEKVDNTVKDEVTEIVEITENVKPVTNCSNGLEANEYGDCLDSKSNFILSIPYQCPAGYRRDWLGFCRPLL